MVRGKCLFGSNVTRWNDFCHEKTILLFYLLLTIKRKTYVAFPSRVAIEFNRLIKLKYTIQNITYGKLHILYKGRVIFQPIFTSIFAKLTRKYIYIYIYISFRQVVARTILETLRVVTDDSDDVNSVLNVMSRLADDVGKVLKFSLLSSARRWGNARMGE